MTAASHSDIRQAVLYHDELIADAMPAWLRSANPEQLQQLQDATSLSLYWRGRLQRVLDQMQGIEGFCKSRFEQALHARWPSVDPTLVSWRQGEREVVITPQPIGSPVTTAVYRNRPLLEAALANFSAAQTEPGGMLAGNGLVATRPSDVALPTATAFASFCRTLDLGGQYQQHLQQVFETHSENEPSPRSILSRHLRYALLVESQRSRIEGHLDAGIQGLLSELCNLRQPLQVGPANLYVGRLRLLGYTLERIVVVDGHEVLGYADDAPEQAVAVYIPGDPYGALRGYPSLRHFANDLGRRLRTPAYQRFFARFVRRRDSQGFFSAVIDGYEGVGGLGNIRLGERVVQCDVPLFDCLAQKQIDQLKDDASLIAVPVATVDQAVQREHERRLAAEGWTLLNLAGLFVPAIGAALLAVTAWQVVDETFEGVAAWHHGEHDEAMDHLLNVAAQLATLAVVGAGSAALARAWQRSPTVDALLPLTSADGRLRLGRPQLPTASSELPAEAVRDDQGLYRLGDRRWVEMDGRHFPVSRSDDTQPWAVRTAQGVDLPLSHNGAGAWRLWHEAPAQWSDSRYLFRRLSLTQTALDDATIDLILQATDTDADALRALHLNGQIGAAVLRDSTERVALELRLRVLVERLRNAQPITDTPLLAQARRLPAAAGLAEPALGEYLWRQRHAVLEQVQAMLQAGASEHAQVLMRDFPGLGRHAAEAVVAVASEAQREQLSATARVPRVLAEAARRSLRRARVARAYEGLTLDMPQDLDLARLSLGLSMRLPGAPAQLSWRLFEHSRDALPIWESGPILGGRRLDLVHGPEGFEVFDAQGARLTTAPGELFEALATGYNAAERQALGGTPPFAQHLRTLLARQALADREALPNLLGLQAGPGWLRLPTRLADGRLGYPLSGRGQRPLSLGAQVRWLYPLMTDNEVELWAQQIREGGGQVSQTLIRLNRELRLLETHLQQWIRRAPGTLARNDRGRFADQLIAGWRRMVPRMFSASEPYPNYRLSVYGTYLPSVPPLPAEVSFAHIDTLSLRDVGLTAIGTDFLARFPNLRVLELSNNALRALPSDLGLLTQLRELSLEGNAITLDAEQAASLNSLEQLRVLNLADNPLRQAISVEGLSYLRYLSLRNTELPSFPAGLMGRLDLMAVDLRSNRITQIPQSFFNAPPWVARTILLDHNALDAATVSRLETMGAISAVAAGASAEDSASVRDSWLALLEPGPAVERAALWDEVRAREGAEGLFDLLRRLQHSADFTRAGTALGQRVWALVETLQAHTDLAEEVFALANMPLTCQDSAALCFSSLELHLLVWRALRNARTGGGAEESALLRLGRQLWRLDEVDRIALRDIEARRADGANPDQIEVALAYRVGLRQALDLPAQPQDMLFAVVSGVDQARLEQARADVLAAEQPDTLAQSLVQRDFWRSWLERRHAARLDALDAPFQARLARLMEQAEAGASEGQYLTQMNAVRDEREHARTALFMTLTRETFDAQSLGLGN